MDILQKQPFCPCRSSSSSSDVEVYEGFYTPYNTPPYITPPYTYAAHLQPRWLGEQAPPTSSLTLDDVKQQLHQMQHVRFPTPPITPPRAAYAEHAPTTPTPTSIHSHSRRTQSVIMKVQNVSAHSPLHVPAESYTLDEAKSCSSSSECGTSNDFICNWFDCGSIFDSLDGLAQHVTQLHAVASPADGLYYCRWMDCQRSDRGFNARYKMLVHVRTHTKEKPHSCQLCDKSFSRAENLKIHIRSHSGEKPYRCTFEGCQKAYSNSSDRFKHTRTHSMEKPYMCKVPGCQKRYTDPSSLRKHVKTFKHSIQIMGSQPLDVLHQPANSESPYRAEDTARYYLDVSDEMAADYTLKPKLGAESDFWLSARPVHNSYLHDEGFSMDIELETPLDLRINRS